MKIKMVKQSNLSSECWLIQLWGKDSCKTCRELNKKECGGKKIRKTGKNAKGIQIPL